MWLVVKQENASIQHMCPVVLTLALSELGSETSMHDLVLSSSAAALLAVDLS